MKGYEGDLTVLTFNKALFSPQLIFDGMLRHLDAKKKFVMYPRFISIFLDKQLANVPVPLDHFLVNALTSKVFSFMVKKGKHFSGKVTPLFASMLVQPTEDEGAPSERPSEAQPTPSPAHTSEVPFEPQTDSSPAHISEVPIEPQTDPSPRPSPSTIIPDSIPESSGGNLGGHSSSDKSLSGNEGEMTLQSVLWTYCLSLCAQVSDQAKEIQHLKAQIKKLKKQAKPVIKHHRAWMQSVSLKQRLARKRSSKKQWVHKESLISKQEEEVTKGETFEIQIDPLFERDYYDYTLDHMETENAQDVGRTRDIVGEEKENGENILSTEDVLSTNKEKVSTEKEKVSTRQGTNRKYKKSGKGEEERNRIAEEKATNEALIRNYDDIKARIEADRLLAEKLQEEEREQFTIEERAKKTSKHSELETKKFEEIQALYEKVKRSDEDFISIGSAEDERLIKKMNEKGIDSSKNEMVKEESKEEVKEENKEEEKTLRRANQNVVNKAMDKKRYFSLAVGVRPYLIRRFECCVSTGNGTDIPVIPEADRNIVSWKLHGSLGVHTLVTEAGLVIYMLVEKKYPLRKKVLVQMLKLKLESEEDSTMALELIKFVKKLLAELEPEDT
ncbi:hypothetical protein Tco_0545117 [Tanacetum coccineum]